MNKREKEEVEVPIQQEQEKDASGEGAPLVYVDRVDVRPVAKVVPGRAGYVYSPYTQNMVNVEGLASGLLVRDPNDPEKSHLFRTP